MSIFRIFETFSLLVKPRVRASSTSREAIVFNILAKFFVETNMLIKIEAGRAAGGKCMGFESPAGETRLSAFQGHNITERQGMASVAKVNGRSIIVADDELVVLLADILEKMDLVEQKLIQLRVQGSLPSATGADASGTTSRVESAKSTARMFAMKAVDVAKEAVLFCARIDNTYGCLKPRRVLGH
jgi:hypothetical protein